MRAIFDKLVAQYPGSVEKLGTNSELVQSPDFESGVCKVQTLDERLLNAHEKKALKRFLLSEDQDSEESEHESGGEDIDGDWAQDCIDDWDSRKRRKLMVSKDRSMRHVSPTSNVCERLFSREALVMRSHRRRHMSPFHLEMLMYLRSNKVLWDETTVEMCINELPGADATEETA